MAKNWTRGTGVAPKRRIDGRMTYAHIVIVEQILGKKLPADAEVHHFNFDKTDNRPENLVVCPNRAYHRLLHQRTAAFDACGHADWRHCVYCGDYADPATLGRIGNGHYHRACHAQACKLYRDTRHA